MKTENMVNKQILILLCLVWFFSIMFPRKTFPMGGGNPRFLRRLKTSKWTFSKIPISILHIPNTFYAFLGIKTQKEKKNLQTKHRVWVMDRNMDSYQHLFDFSVQSSQPIIWKRTSRFKSKETLYSNVLLACKGKM